MKSLLVWVSSICIVIVIEAFLLLYAKNAVITKAVSVCIVVAMILYWILYERNTRKRKYQELHRDDYFYAKDSVLPLSINWNEINDFLRNSEYGVNMPNKNWFMMDWVRQPCVEDGIKAGTLSMKSFQVLQALSRDMTHLFDEVRFYYDHVPQEDRSRKYEAVKKVLDTKYSGLTEQMRKNIYDQFVMVYEKRWELHHSHG